MKETEMIEPPWILYPEFGPLDFFWREAGQPWMDYVWRPFWYALTEEQKAAYLKQYPEPKEWSGFSIDLNPEFAKLLDELDER
ncbi:Uncharacterised protein [Legionella donaldsonii]|uniref:Uncharacterized protein n=2 Tax=Legionella donaldsonii TaxID=45060 RepID=A0A378J8E7_9GAMM|nr:Uncharacterised protein [Legionella donaldsonii]